jgi:hypothetical protein
MGRDSSSTVASNMTGGPLVVIFVSRCPRFGA